MNKYNCHVIMRTDTGYDGEEFNFSIEATSKIHARNIIKEKFPFKPCKVTPVCVYLAPIIPTLTRQKKKNVCKAKSTPKNMRDKADNLEVNQSFLSARFEDAKSKGYPNKAKWIEFCEELLSCGYNLSLYEAKKTFSKYITVRREDRKFKVRFSNHKPIKSREINGDCDFFVGITNLSITRKEDAILAVHNFFNGAVEQ